MIGLERRLNLLLKESDYKSVILFETLPKLDLLLSAFSILCLTFISCLFSLKLLANNTISLIGKVLGDVAAVSVDHLLPVLLAN